MQVDLVQVAHCLEVSSELQRGDAPDADLVVQQHLGDAATGSLNAVPGLMRALASVNAAAIGSIRILWIRV
nr:hypothetical protein [Pseudomonas aeruginosa]